MSLSAITTINLDMSSPNVNIVHAKQYDSSGRILRARLLNNGEPWTVPTGVNIVIRYKKPDLIGGFYDTTESGSPAITFVNGSNRTAVDLVLVGQMLTTAGTVPCELSFYDGMGVKLTTFTWKLIVEPSVISDDDVVSSEYYNALTETISEILNTQTQVEAFVGAPLVASSKADMTDHTKIYVYVRTNPESGMTSGNWYYWNGSDWTSGGIYNAAAVGNMIMLQTTPPSDPSCKIWVYTTADQIRVLSYPEFETALNNVITNAQIDTLFA